jgi:hypothetical protein
MNKNGTEAFGQRGLAGLGADALLGRDENIFKRVHETYQDKHRKGAVK